MSAVPSAKVLAPPEDAALSPAEASWAAAVPICREDDGAALLHLARRHLRERDGRVLAPLAWRAMPSDVHAQFGAGDRLLLALFASSTSTYPTAR